MKTIETTRQRKIWAAKRCMADLWGGQVWKKSIDEIRELARYTLAVRRDGLASDEITTLEFFAAEWKGY